MNAKQRFVTAAWLLQAALAIGGVGVVAWSHLDARHAVTRTGLVACPATAPNHDTQISNSASGASGIVVMYATSDACTGGGREIVGFHTTPNHLPGFLLVALGGALALAGIALLRADPTGRLDAAT